MSVSRRKFVRIVSALLLGACVVGVALLWSERRGESAASPTEQAGSESLVARAPHVGPSEARNAVDLPKETPVGALQASASRQFVIVKRAFDGAPVAEAEVLTTDDREAWGEAGRTSEAGTLELPRAEHVKAIGVVARGFLREVREVHEGETWPLEVLLQPGATICGQVLRADGAPGVPEVRVVALEVTQPDSAADVAARLARKDPRIRSATVDSRGNFCIVGLRTNESVGLQAGGEGFVQQSMWIPATAGAAGLEVLVSQLYGARLVPSNPDGSAMAAEDLGTFELSWWSDDAAGDPAAAGLAALLATGDSGLTRNDARSRLALLTAPIELDELAPFAFEAGAPGYATSRGTFALPRLRGAPNAVPIALERTAAGFATLTVRLRHATPDSTMAFPRAQLQLEATDGSTHKFALEPSESGIHTLEGVPLGRFRARLLVLPTKHWHPAEATPAPEVEVQPEGSELELTLAPVGEALLHVLAADGAAFTGRIRYTLGNVTGEPPKFRPLATTSMLPPYRLSGLAPGRYYVNVEIPKVTNETDGSSRAVFDVGPEGGPVELRLRIVD